MKFSIRDLLLVTVIAALAVGWWVDHRRQAMKEKTLVKLQKEADAKLRLLGNYGFIPAATLPINAPAAMPPAASMYPLGDYLTPPPSLKTKLESDRPPTRLAP